MSFFDGLQKISRDLLHMIPMEIVRLTWKNGLWLQEEQLQYHRDELEVRRMEALNKNLDLSLMRKMSG